MGHRRFISAFEFAKILNRYKGKSEKQVGEVFSQLQSHLKGKWKTAFLQRDMKEAFQASKESNFKYKTGNVELPSGAGKHSIVKTPIKDAMLKWDVCRGYAKEVHGIGLPSLMSEAMGETSRPLILTLKQLALGLCGEALDGETNDEWDNVVTQLTGAICDGKLKARHKDKPFPKYGSDWRTRDLATHGETFEGMPAKSCDYRQYAIDNPDLIKIRLDYLESFIEESRDERNSRESFQILAKGLYEKNLKKARNEKEKEEAKRKHEAKLKFDMEYLAGLYPVEIRRRYEEHRQLFDMAAMQTVAVNADKIQTIPPSLVGRERSVSNKTTYQGKMNRLHEQVNAIFPLIMESNPNANIKDLISDNRFLQARRDSELQREERPKNKTLRDWVRPLKKSALPKLKKA